MKQIFEGTGVAIVTPLVNDKIDYEAFENIINRDIELGAKAIIVLGTTGEGATMSEYERKEVISFSKSIINDRVPLIVGTGNCNFETSFYNTSMAKHLGADAALVVTPYYNKTTQAGLVEYYTRLAKIGLPIIMYNVPSRTGLNIEIDTIEKLIDNPMIVGIKESTCDINRIMHLAQVCRNKMAIYSGEDDLNYVFYTLGASGCVSVTANIFADKVQEVFDCVKNNNFSKALEKQEHLQKINKALFIETNPIPVKNMMARMGLIKNEVRMPLVTLSENNNKKISEIQDEYGL